MIAQDIRILALLQDDAARRHRRGGGSGEPLSKTPAGGASNGWRRRGSSAAASPLLDPAKLGVGVTVFVALRAAEHTEDWLEQFAAAVRRIPEVTEFHRMSGDIDYLLKLRVADIADYDACL